MPKLVVMKTLTDSHLEKLPVYPGLIDTHIHLDSEAYQSDLAECLKRAARVGLESMLLPSTDPASSGEIARLARLHPQLRGALGIHPHQAECFDPGATPGQWSTLLQDCDWVAIGETGLECHYDFCSLEVQKQSLEAHFELAGRTGLPLIFHCRLAEQPLYDMVAHAGLPVRGVVHCFTGGWDWAEKFLDLGFYLGLGGLTTLPKAVEVHEVARRVPSDRWLLETDGPYLAPVPFRGFRNESCLLPLVIDRLAELRSQSPAELVRQANANARALFSLPGHSPEAR